MGVDYRTITAAWWQPQVGTLGGVVTDLDDINQCVLTILLTPKGSDPLRPDFAINLFEYVDKPINVVRAPLVRDVIQALQQWEKRITITRVTLDPQEDLAGWVLSVTWTLSGEENGSGDTQTTSVLVPVVGSLVVSPFVAIPFASTFTLDGIDGGVL